MRKSRSETADTKERILSVASALFLKQGLAAVGMRDIMAAAGLTRGAFYRHFESKEQLIGEVNAASGSRLLAMLQKKTAGKSKEEALEVIVSTYLTQSQGKGNANLCSLAMIGAELGHFDRRVRDISIGGYQHLVRLVADYLPEQEETRKMASASSIISVMVGAVTLANIAPDRATAKSILSNAKETIQRVARPER